MIYGPAGICGFVAAMLAVTAVWLVGVMFDVCDQEERGTRC